MQSTVEKQALTVGDVKNILGIGTNSAYNLIHSNAFPVRKIGRSYRIPSAQFFAWLERYPSAYDAASNGKLQEYGGYHE
ncbi:helix-turn-helix domain-containing protein [Oscillospiraceae bacterium OttesenSCG-928-F05]|nr:helix-turn-helix domain-containing protein [Oscillospiraceae bacterium OttesenSCG-928-F05]